MFTTVINQIKTVEEVLINILGFYGINVEKVTVISAQASHGQHFVIHEPLI